MYFYKEKLDFCLILFLSRYIQVNLNFKKFKIIKQQEIITLWLINDW